MANGEFVSSSVEMDVFESTVTDLLDDSMTGRRDIAHFFFQNIL